MTLVLPDVTLEVIALGDHEWRVCNNDIDPSDATRLLAFVEEQGGSFELLRMSRTTGVSDYFDCLDDALAALGKPVTK